MRLYTAHLDDVGPAGLDVLVTAHPDGHVEIASRRGKGRTEISWSRTVALIPELLGEFEFAPVAGRHRADMP